MRGNLLWDYGNGSLRLDAKYLNDRNGFFEFIPANGFTNPKFAPGFSNTTSVLPQRGPHNFTNPDGTTDTYDASKLVHSQALSFGLTWENDISDVIHVQNRARYSENKTNWNTGAVIFPVGLDDFIVGPLTGSFLIPGTITYRSTRDNSVAAVVRSFSGFDRNVLVNNLPNQNVLANGILTQVAFAQRYKTREFQNQLTFGAKLGNHQFAAGGYISLNKLRQSNGGAGFGISTFENRPVNLSATLVDDRDGRTYQLTDPTGYGVQGSGLFDGDGYSGSQNQLSLFGGDTWDVSDQLSIDVGLRYESLDYNVTNLTLAGSGAFGANAGGVDGNPLTLYDNRRNLYGTPTRVKRSYTFFNYTGAINYKVSDEFQTYARYTKGRKAPDFGIIQGLDAPDEISTIFPKAQTIEQIEIGLKYNRSGLRLGLYPFYSKLSNVADQQIALDNNQILYTPPPQFGQIKTIGVEFNGDVDLGDLFNIRTAITVQSAKASKFGTYLFNTPLRSDDQLITTPKGDADNNPKLLTRTTATFKPTEAFQIFLTHSYLGKRAANRNNAFFLPGFHTVDVGASYEFAQAFKLQFNVSNVFNQLGVLSYARSGGFFNSLDRQGLTRAAVTAAPNQLYSIIPNQPRAFFVTGTAKF